MEDESGERYPEAAAIEALLREIVDALRMRGLLTRGDIAGAFFRADWVLKTQAEGEHRITDASAVLRLWRRYWEKRMTFHPDLAALKYRRSEWLFLGGQGPDPANAQEIVRLYDAVDREERAAQRHEPVRRVRPRRKSPSPGGSAST